MAMATPNNIAGYDYDLVNTPPDHLICKICHLHINNHLGNSDGCQFEEMKCSNECGKMMEQQYLTNHVETECPRRKVNCQYCHDRGEHQFIEGQHKEECPKLPLPCPNKCEVGTVPREDMEAHRKECPLEMIQCEYCRIGRKRTRLAHKDLEEHKKQKMEEHLMMTRNVLADTEAQLDAAFKQIAILANLQLCSASSDPRIRSMQLDAMTTMFKFICPVTVKMTEYNSKKKDEVQWYRDSFYTHNKGYKMSLRVDASGNGEDTHLSVFLFLMKGPHDDELKWPLRGEFEIKLLNQISDSQHHSITVTFDDDITNGSDKRVTEGERDECGWGFPQFISNEDLYKTTPLHQFLKDDCLFIQVTKL